MSRASASSQDLDAAFHDASRSRAGARRGALRAHPSDADAHYQVGAAYGFRASYTATVEGRVVGSLGPRDARIAEHERVLALDPARKDAGLIVGLYRYAVASLPAPLRLMAQLAGFGGGRERGLAAGRGGRALSERRADERALHAHRACTTARRDTTMRCA